MSHRFGLLTDPLGVTGFMWSAMQTLLASSQYPVFKVQAQRGVTLLVFNLAVNRFVLLISAFLRQWLRGIKIAPCRERRTVGRPPFYGRCPLSDCPHRNLAFQVRAPLSRRSSLATLAPCSDERNSTSGIVQIICTLNRGKPTTPVCLYYFARTRAKRRFPA